MTARPVPGASVVCAVVLAGGRSTRFGADKLAVPLDGRPLLHHAVAAVAAVAREVIVAGEAGPVELPAIAGVAVRRVPDAMARGGPLAGLESALQHGGRDVALVVGGDMPALVPAVLQMLVDALVDADAAEASALVHEGRRQPLPIAVRAAAAADAARRVRESGDSSLQAMLARLAVREIGEPAWRRLDPAAASLRDVDRPADLER